jgi:hypothetical protein
MTKIQKKGKVMVNIDDTYDLKGTVSVPVEPEIEKQIIMVSEANDQSKAAAMRQAWKMYWRKLEQEHSAAQSTRKQVR